MVIDRRDFLKILGVGTAVFVMGAAGRLGAADETPAGGFMFLQISDTHWGFNDPKINPDFAGTLKKGVASINSLEHQPDFIIFTGDLTHTTDDEKERRERLTGFRDIVSALKVKDVRFMPGEHDAGLDEAAAYKEFFGTTNYTFEHKGVNFIVLDNVSSPRSSLGDDQLQWLSAQLTKLDKDSRIVVFTHRPPFDLYPQWDWWTQDGAKAIDILMPYKNVTVLYGHIHQENHHMTDHIAHHSARGMMYPLPAPGSLSKKILIPWDPGEPYRGIGFRTVETGGAQLALVEHPVIETK